MKPSIDESRSWLNALGKNGSLPADHEALDELFGDLLTALRIGDAKQSFAYLDLFWARLAMHIRAENLHLFPVILGALRAENKNGQLAKAEEAIAQLRKDHNYFMDHLATAVKRMREILSDRSTDSRTSLEDVRQMISPLSGDFESHNRLEEELVYLLPDMLLEPVEQTALAADIRRELENLPPRFAIRK